MRTTTIDATDLAGRLRAAGLSGRVATPDDADYDALRRVADASRDDRPAAIALVESPDDVARVVSVARATGAQLAVRSGGHSGAGHSTTDGGIVLDLRGLKGLEIDAVDRTAWAETGLTAVEVTSAAAEHGLAVGFGDTGSVGIGGITTGGGIGFLVRKHGMTIDSVLAADVVTADGQSLRIDADHHPELFWAIRGGSGNVGVVTRFKYRLQPLAGVVGGILVLPATADTVAGFMAAAAAAPEELSTIANVMNCPPMPFVPEEHHGKLVNLAFMCYAGDAESGQRALAPFRALATPLADLVAPIKYPEMYAGEPEDADYRPTATGRTMFLDHVDRATAATMLERLEASDAPMRAVQLRALGGAMARVPADATAFAHRSAPILAVIVSFYEGGADKPRRKAWVEDLSRAIDQGVPGAYVNFLFDDSPESVRRAYPEATRKRLARVKAAYDPDNFFRHNQNIPPA
ncbi:MAG TPA: FAD-binding oxidoreductase [Candidatus Limnocylindrales bacterium]